MSNIIPILTEILSRGIFNVIMATKRTVSVILLQEENDSDETISDKDSEPKTVDN